MEEIIRVVNEKRETELADRVVAQLNFARRLSVENDGKYDDIVAKAEAAVKRSCANGDPITIDTVRRVEDILEALRDEAKSYRVICTAHAHIDMNWQWGWDETVGVVIDTIATMLKLFDEYPAFKFSLSQASTYKILADYAPEMFERVKQLVHEGRFEVTAPSWVECDKNMPSGESLAMQLIEAKTYLSKMLDISPDTINVDFQPDTFGHSINVPEILHHAGVKYYYHCRGTNAPYQVYRWRAPSGSEVLVNRENNFYSSPVRSDMGLVAIEMAKKQGFKTTLRVYGVGDHGGGPSRRDIEMLLKMASWPCFPDFVLGTYAEFFAECEKHYDVIPVVENTEMNCVFDGCYNTQTEIKTGNKACEAEIYKTDAIGALACICGQQAASVSAASKQKLLLNHFHDIVTGSCVAASKQYALAMYQEIFADAKTARKLAARGICDAIDTSALFRDAAPIDRSFGAGAGSEMAEVGMGTRRVYQVFNSLPQDTTQVVEIRMWDWLADRNRLVFTDADGAPLTHQVTSNGFDYYWGHHYVNVLVKVAVPAMGYTTIIADEGSYDGLQASYWAEKRQQVAEQFVLENEYLRIEFDTMDMTIRKAVDKESGNEYVDAKAGVFRYIMEAAHKEISNNWRSEMSSWLIGRHKSAEDLHKNCEVSCYHGAVRDGIVCEFKFHNSKLKFEAYLDKGSRLLKYKTHIDWLEVGSHETGVPQLAFAMPVKGDAFTFDVPFGTVVRKPAGHDLPANTFAACGDIALFTKNVHGFRCTEDALSLTVIRGAFDPDPYAEVGGHTMEFAVGFGVDPVVESKRYMQELVVMTNAPHGGSLPTAYSAFTLDGAQVSAVHTEGEALVVRVYNPSAQPCEATLSFRYDIKEARLTDFFGNGYAELTVNGGRSITHTLLPNQIATIRVKQ